MRVIILGAQGNLGTEIKKILLAKPEINLLALDKQDLDVLDEPALRSKLDEFLPELIINTVAYNAVDECESEAGFALAKKLNGEVPANLGRFALEHQAILLHYSSDYVFSGDRKGGYSEDDVPDPINNYGRSKLMGETAIKDMGASGLKYYLIRTSKLFGPKGESPVAKASFFDTMISLAKKQEEIKVVDGELSCFTYTPDLAQAAWSLVEDKAPFGLYHLVNSEPVTWYGAAQELFSLLGKKLKLTAIASEDLPRPAKRPQASVLLSTKVEAMRSYREALREYLRETKSTA